ncbi:MAG: hypothetical protein JWP97_5974 [Labilithrix sp.]|nr:hypothetical protein [Labilithrix sp.]
MTETALRLLALASVASLACLTACGSNDAPPPATPSSTPAAASASVTADGGTTEGAAKPSSTAGWPFAPAPTDDEKKAQLDRLGKDPGPIKSNWTPPGKSERYGHAEGFIDAPYDAVKARLVDFPHYKELAGPKFKKVSVVDKQPGGTDLYFQLPIMKGIVTIWYVTRFPAARPAAGGGEVVEGSFVKGNIKDMQIVFTVRPGPDDKRTILQCDLSLALSIPAPQEAVDEELRDACGDAVNALRARLAAPHP